MTLVVSDWDILAEALAEGVECRIEGFDGEFAFLSNFFPSPIEVDRIVYPTVEHAYQAAKATVRLERVRIAALESPGQAKRAGAKLALRPNWADLKVPMMTQFVRQKFETHDDLKQKLVATGTCVLEETNTWGDRFWGVSGGTGENHLGLILMECRSLFASKRSEST
jgi:ribA/ribD-fused uncharacterized protein